MNNETNQLDGQAGLVGRAIHENKPCSICGKPWSSFVVHDGKVEAFCVGHSPKSRPFGILSETVGERRERRKEYVELINRRGFDGIKSLRWLVRLGKHIQELKEIELEKIWGGDTNGRKKT